MEDPCCRPSAEKGGDPAHYPIPRSTLRFCPTPLPLLGPRFPKPSPLAAPGISKRGRPTMIHPPARYMGVSRKLCRYDLQGPDPATGSLSAIGTVDFVL